VQHLPRPRRQRAAEASLAKRADVDHRHLRIWHDPLQSKTHTPLNSPFVAFAIVAMQTYSKTEHPANKNAGQASEPLQPHRLCRRTPTPLNSPAHLFGEGT
jgi:hypothetical protein